MIICHWLHGRLCAKIIPSFGPALSEGDSRRDFDDELAAAFEVEETLADARLFPPSNACMPEAIDNEVVEAGGV